MTHTERYLKKIEELEKIIEDRGYAFQDAQNKCLLENMDLKKKLSLAVEGLKEISKIDAYGDGRSAHFARETLAKIKGG